MLRLNQDRSSWLLPLFLLIAVVAPSGSVLWFMNEAGRSQGEAARQRVTEAYRGQLRLLRSGVDESWEQRAAALAKADGFAAAVAASGADAVVLLDQRGMPVYPARPFGPAADPARERADWQSAGAEERQGRLAVAANLWHTIANSEQDANVAARAAQAEIRCLVRSGHTDAALTAIAQRFSAGRLAGARDLDGRLIAADEQLLALRLLKPGDDRFDRIARLLTTRVNDYGEVSLISGQRLFLMSELKALAPAGANFPLEQAELLAEQFLEAGRGGPGNTGLEASGLRDVWKLTSENRRTMALYRTAKVVSLVDGVLARQGSSRSVRFTVSAPGSTAGDGIAAGPMLPGWQLGFTLLDTKPLDEASARRKATYFWLSGAVILATLLMALLAAQFFRRQARLNRLKTDLVAAVSHELKTPLASMRLLLETLLEDGTADAGKTRDYLQLIAAENLRLARLVENFLTFSRIERNRQHFEFAPTTPAAIVESAVAAMGERLQPPGCQLAVEVNPGLPPLVADQDALTTALRNLLDNACKYTPAEKRIRICAHEQNGRVAFDVEDNGIGIAPREQKRIFRRFYQVDRRLARETGGCGLGLSIVEYIVRAHGGEVSVESRPGAGSTFHVLLPCRPAAREAGA